MKTLTASSRGVIGPGATRHSGVRKILLVCGLVSSPFYVVANDVIAAGRYDGYSRISQAISELSSPGAPSRPLLGPLIVIYDLLMIAFGIGIRQSAEGKRALRLTGGLVIAGGGLALAGAPFPMSQREGIPGKGTFADIMHMIVFGIAAPLLVFAAIGFGARAFGKRFRNYSILTLTMMCASFGLTWIDAARIASGKPTPWLGVVERTFIGSWLLWFAVLAAALLPNRTLKLPAPARAGADR